MIISFFSGSLILFDLLCNQNIENSSSSSAPDKQPPMAPASVPPSINVLKTPQQQQTPAVAKLPPATADNISVASEGSNANSLSASSAKPFGSSHSIARSSDDSKRGMTLEQALEQLHLSSLMPKFEQECVDFDALVSDVIYIILLIPEVMTPAIFGKSIVHSIKHENLPYFYGNVVFFTFTL